MGCGAVGSRIAEQLARIGIDTLTLWDADTVEPKNINNQIYKDYQAAAKMKKVKALSDILADINTGITVYTHDTEVTKDTQLTGYIFCCIDNIDVRKELFNAWKTNPYIKYVTDTRMGLYDGYVYSADWSNNEQKDALINSTDFTHNEVVVENACHIEQSIIFSPIILASYAVSNFTQYLKGEQYYKTMILNMISPELNLAYK